MSDYSSLDRSSVLKYIFFPRKDFIACPENGFDLFVNCKDNIFIHCRFYIRDKESPLILFFHGNGEVVSDYNEIAPLYHQRGLNLIVADYRGYGNSNGIPTLKDLNKDAHAIFREVRSELQKRELRDDLWIMGRSLGSISAFELAYKYPGEIRGIIIESGFPSVVRIIRHLGIPAYDANLEKIDQGCLERLKMIFIPTLIIHGERDTLVPLKEAKDIFEHLGTEKKELIVIPLANHNNIMFVGFQKYFDAIQRFIEMTEIRSSG